MTRIVGLDHGSRRIGVAVADSETGLAFARPAIQFRSAAQATSAVADLVASEHASLVVVGLPYRMDGSEGEQAAAAREFGERLASIGLAVAYQDERLTTWQATEQLVTAGGNARDRARGHVDSAAARVILQEYLDARRSPERLEETE